MLIRAFETSSTVLPCSQPLLRRGNPSCSPMTRNRHVSMNPLATKNRKHPKSLPQIQILLRHKTISRTHLYILHHLHFGLVFVPLANTSVKVEAHKVLGFQQNQMLQSFVVECLKEFSQTNGCMIGLGGSKSLTLTCSMGFRLRTDVGPCALPIHPTTNW